MRPLEGWGSKYNSSEKHMKIHQVSPSEMIILLTVNIGAEFELFDRLAAVR